MEPNAAEENLQVIRTLMERSALYRRALAPVMLTAGALGLAGWLIAVRTGLGAGRGFICFWFTIAAVTIAVSLLIVRRQALKSAEPFWTPPTRRVTGAMMPGLMAGLLFTMIPLMLGLGRGGERALVEFWLICHGCALHAAGLFSSRGVRLLGWAFILTGFSVLYYEFYAIRGMNHLDRGLVVESSGLGAHAIMGLTFGGLHLLAGIYLYFTEKGRNAQ